MNDRDLTLSARYVFPVAALPIEDGALTVRGGRIAWVGRQTDRRADLELGNAAILPGLVNAHTHLDLGGLRGRIPRPASFVDWLRDVIAYRRTARQDEVEQAIREGIAESLAAGTTLLGDISADGSSWSPLARASLKSVVFFEVLGLRAERREQTWTAAERLLELASHSQTARASPGISPHAPYSTSAALYRAAAELAAGRRMPLATHLAETREELQLLAERSGPLRELLQGMGAWDDAWQPLGSSPSDYLRLRASNADWLIIHANRLPPEALEPSAMREGSGSSGPARGRLAVVYCPRTHAYFRHPPHPWVAVAPPAIRVCLGTDSLASNPDLSILEEMRLLHRRYPWLPGRRILEMATLNGAWALRRERDLGTLEAGKAADLCVVPLPNRDETDPHHLLWRSALPVARTMLDGQFVFAPSVS